jgi:hypothetical protein
MKTCTHPLCDCFCIDAIGVVTHWHDTGGAPYDVPCPDCEWRDDWEDGRSDQFSYDAEGICRTCEGSGLKTLKTLEESPWIIDGFTYAMAGLERMFLGPDDEDEDEYEDEEVDHVPPHTIRQHRGVHLDCQRLL